MDEHNEQSPSAGESQPRGEGLPRGESLSGDAGAPAAGRGRSRSLKLLSLVYIGAGINHFVIPRTYESIVPPGLGDPKLLVAVSGVAEIAGGLGVLPRRTRRLSGLGLIALLAAVFPANIYMARNPDKFAQIPAWSLYARLPLQPLAMWWAWRATRPS